MPFPTVVHTLPQLIQWLAETYHGGSRYAIAKHARVSHALIDFWYYGLVRDPRRQSLEKLARAYDLPLYDLMMLGTTEPSPPPKRPRTKTARRPTRPPEQP
jgi:hypothetical protein